MKEIINTNEAPAPIGPYNQAVKVGQMLFLSGQIALDAATGELVNATLTEETHQVMKNIQAVLSHAGSNMDKVIKCSIFLKDLGNFSAVNEIYGQYFTEGSEPARECVEVSRLPKDVNVEISVIAAV
jgi:2-iminobutanoate/2-iminopropanoate deaminase